MFIGLSGVWGHQLSNQKTIDCDKTTSGQAISGYQTEDETNGARSLGAELSIGLISHRANMSVGFEINIGGDFLANTNYKKRSIAEEETIVSDETDDLMLVKSRRLLDTNLLLSIAPRASQAFALLGVGVGAWRDEVKVVNIKNDGEEGYLAGNLIRRTHNLFTSYESGESKEPVHCQEALGKHLKLLPSLVGGIGFSLGGKHTLAVRMLYKYYLLGNKVQVIAYDKDVSSRSVQITHDKFRHNDLSLSCGYRFNFT